MEELSKIDVSLGPLHEMWIMPVRSKVMMTGIGLKIFNLLTEPKTSDALAKDIDSHAGNTRIFLDTLAGMALLVKENGKYQNAPISEQYLVEGSPTYLGEFFAGRDRWFTPVLENLEGIVKNGPSAVGIDDAFRGSADEWAKSARTSAQYMRSGYAQQVADIVSRLPEFPSMEKMIDLGGGAGLNGIAIVAKHPSMKGAIFDQPPVAKVADGFIREYGLEERMETKAGDYLKDPIGEGYDLIFMSATINFALPMIDDFLKRIYDALNPGGVFINFSEGMTDEGTKPVEMLLEHLSMLMSGMDFRLHQGFIAEAMIRAGFKSVRSLTVQTIAMPMDMDIAQK